MKLVSHERKTEGARDDYETPRALFDRFNATYQFTIDVAANQKNHLCDIWLGPGGVREDALSSPWGSRNWCNPPFSHWVQFAEKAVEEMRAGRLTAFLCPPRVDTAGYHELLIEASEHIFIRPRLQFTIDGKRPVRIDKKTGKEVESGNGAGSMVAIFMPHVAGVRYGNPRLCFMDLRAS